MNENNIKYHKNANKIFLASLCAHPQKKLTKCN